MRAVCLGACRPLPPVGAGGIQEHHAVRYHCIGLLQCRAGVPQCNADLCKAPHVKRACGAAPTGHTAAAQSLRADGLAGSLAVGTAEGRCGRQCCGKQEAQRWCWVCWLSASADRRSHAPGAGAAAAGRSPNARSLCAYHQQLCAPACVQVLIYLPAHHFFGH